MSTRVTSRARGARNASTASLTSTNNALTDQADEPLTAAVTAEPIPTAPAVPGASLQAAPTAPAVATLAPRPAGFQQFHLHQQHQMEMALAAKANQVRGSWCLKSPSLTKVKPPARHFSVPSTRLLHSQPCARCTELSSSKLKMGPLGTHLAGGGGGGGGQSGPLTDTDEGIWGSGRWRCCKEQRAVVWRRSSSRGRSSLGPLRRRRMARGRWDSRRSYHPPYTRRLPPPPPTPPLCCPCLCAARHTTHPCRARGRRA